MQCVKQRRSLVEVQVRTGSGDTASGHPAPLAKPKRLDLSTAFWRGGSFDNGGHCGHKIGIKRNALRRDS